MKTERMTSFLPSAVDQLPLSVLKIVPEHIQAAVCLVHGMCEHKERYIPLMEYLAQQGFLCVIADLRGHGQSIQKEDDLGYMGPSGAEAMVSDLSQLIQSIRSEYPSVPVFLFSHSMGTLVARAYVKESDQSIDGLIVCGSPSPQAGMSIGKKLISFLTKRKGDHYRSKFITGMVFGSFVKRFPNENSSSAWICSDPEVVREYDADPHCGFMFTLNGYESLMNLLQRTYQDKTYMLSKPELPIWFISGEQDPCMIDLKTWEKTIQLFRDAGYKNVDSKCYAGMRHEICNEKEKEKVFFDIADHLKKWLENTPKSTIQ